MGTCKIGEEEKLDEKTIKALGDPSRYRLLQLMSARSYCVRALAKSSGLSESAVSQHLKILREAGLVYGVKRGYYTHYCVDKDALDRVIRDLESLRDARRQPCEGPFYGCPESEAVRCRSYVPPQNRAKEVDKPC